MEQKVLDQTTAEEKAMEEAIKCGKNMRRVRELIKDIKVEEYLGDSCKRMLPLSYAASIGNCVIASVLLQMGANINEVSGYTGVKCHYTPLWLAVYNNRIKMIEFLLSRNADPNVSDTSLVNQPLLPTPLFAAAFNSNVRATRILLATTVIDATVFNFKRQSAKDLAENVLIEKLIERKFHKQRSKQLDSEIRIHELAETNEDIKYHETKIAELCTKAEQLWSEISEKTNDLEILRMEIPMMHIKLNAMKEKKELLKVECNIHTFQVDDSFIKCPCCLEVQCGMIIFQCRHGHPFCNNCARKVNRCPMCRTPLDDHIRCLVLEKFLAEKQETSANL